MLLQHFRQWLSASMASLRVDTDKHGIVALMTFLSGIAVIPFDADAAREYGRIRDDLKTKGSLIGANDMLIAAHAKALDLGYS